MALQDLAIQASKSRNKILISGIADITKFGASSHDKYIILKQVTFVN
jgi:hypothetical protein